METSVDLGIHFIYHLLFNNSVYERSIMIFKRMLGPVFTGLRKESDGKNGGMLYKMTPKEQIALKEAKKIVSSYNSKVGHPFKYGQGRLDE